MRDGVEFLPFSDVKEKDGRLVLGLSKHAVKPFLAKLLRDNVVSAGDRVMKTLREWRPNLEWSVLPFRLDQFARRGVERV